MNGKDPKKLFGHTTKNKKGEILRPDGTMTTMKEDDNEVKQKGRREQSRNRTLQKKPALAAGVVAVDTGMSVAMGLARVKTTGAPPQTFEVKEVVGRAAKAGRVDQQLSEDGDPGSAPGPSTSHTGSPASGEPSTPSSSAAPRRSRRC